MAHFFKPEIAKERIEKVSITQDQLPLSVQTVLTRHQIEFIKQFRIVIYGLFSKQFKKQLNTNEPSGNWRRNHRKIGIAGAFVALTFALSGAYHVFSKLKPSTLSQMVYEPAIAVKDINIRDLVTVLSAMGVLVVCLLGLVLLLKRK